MPLNWKIVLLTISLMAICVAVVSYKRVITSAVEHKVIVEIQEEVSEKKEDVNEAIKSAKSFSDDADASDSLRYFESRSSRAK